MRFRTTLALISLIAAAGFVQSCATRVDAPSEPEPTPHAFLRKAGGWALSVERPAFPFNLEQGLQALVGAGGDDPFGCGLTRIRTGYFSGTRGELSCIVRTADSGRTFRRVQRGAQVARVYDAAPSPVGLLVLAQPYGSSAARALVLDPDGQVRATIDLPGSAPEQAFILSSGRVALLRSGGTSCNWTLLERTAGGFTPVATAPADRPLCNPSAFGAEALRDQTTGQTYLRSRHPVPNALYRIDDNGPRNPASLVAADFGAGVHPPSSSGADYVTIDDGLIYFTRPDPAGLIIGRYDLRTGVTRSMDLRAPSGRWQDGERLYGFIVSKSLAAAPQAVLMKPDGATRTAPLAF